MFNNKKIKLSIQRIGRISIKRYRRVRQAASANTINAADPVAATLSGSMVIITTGFDCSQPTTTLSSSQATASSGRSSLTDHTPPSLVSTKPIEPWNPTKSALPKPKLPASPVADPEASQLTGSRAYSPELVGRTKFSQFSDTTQCLDFTAYSPEPMATATPRASMAAASPSTSTTAASPTPFTTAASPQTSTTTSVEDGFWKTNDRLKRLKRLEISFLDFRYASMTPFDHPAFYPNHFEDSISLERVSDTTWPPTGATTMFVDLRTEEFHAKAKKDFRHQVNHEGEWLVERVDRNGHRIFNNPNSREAREHYAHQRQAHQHSLQRTQSQQHGSHNTSTRATKTLHLHNEHSIYKTNIPDYHERSVPYPTQSGSHHRQSNSEHHLLNHHSHLDSRRHQSAYHQAQNHQSHQLWLYKQQSQHRNGRRLHGQQPHGQQQFSHQNHNVQQCLSQQQQYSQRQYGHQHRDQQSQRQQQQFDHRQHQQHYCSQHFGQVESKNQQHGQQLLGQKSHGQQHSIGVSNISNTTTALSPPTPNSIPNRLINNPPTTRLTTTLQTTIPTATTVLTATGTPNTTTLITATDIILLTGKTTTAITTAPFFKKASSNGTLWRIRR
ncbi:hypothetical protein BG015_010396 [Linnemannia schmuckeri]|uniref:Uncharacterized protein n=1 Tax=Linnemannia schmuckeri TaxID=64567 RepID=A0A9P5RW69_9FUNG|nr:hypothetical protein BG015_010396 [Linnemannia schmuckeri]